MILLSFREKKYVQAVGLISVACLLFFIFRLIFTGTLRYWFIPENLALAWVGLIVAWLLVRNLAAKRWASWQNIGLSLLWLFFLPNSWYVLTDFMHVYPTGEVSELYDIIMMGLLVTAGFSLGFTGLYMVHKQLRQRLSERISWLIISAILLLSSFAIYLGRILRWNTWDIIADPGGLILNISDRVLSPLDYPRAVNITALFFVILSLIYLAIWWISQPEPKVRRPKRA